MKGSPKARYVLTAPGAASGHTCHWPGCPRPVKPAMWGCRAHWNRLPAALRARIWSTYQPGQEIDKTPSADYLEAAKAVQDWIQAHVEGAPKP